MARLITGRHGDYRKKGKERIPKQVVLLTQALMMTYPEIMKKHISANVKYEKLKQVVVKSGTPKQQALFKDNKQNIKAIFRTEGS